VNGGGAPEALRYLRRGSRGKGGGVGKASATVIKMLLSLSSKKIAGWGVKSAKSSQGKREGENQPRDKTHQPKREIRLSIKLKRSK